MENEWIERLKDKTERNEINSLFNRILILSLIEKLLPKKDFSLSESIEELEFRLKTLRKDRPYDENMEKLLTLIKAKD
jgi:hypothetical protein